MTKEEIRSLTRARWRILAASCVINLCIGSLFAWSVLAGPMAAELGERDISIVFSIANAITFITMIAGGLLNDKYGPRWVMLTGSVMYALGFFFSGFARNVGDMIVSFSVVLGLGISLVYTCTISNTIKFFPDRRGLVGGLTTASYGISSAIFAAIFNMLNESVGVRGTFKVVGIVFLVVLCAGSLMERKCPDGFVPEGYTPSGPASGSARRDLRPLEMLRTPSFYVMLLMLTCGATFGMMLLSNASTLAANMLGVSAAAASTLVSVLCVFNTAGRLTAGTLSDKLGRINTLTAAMVVAILGLAALYLADVGASLVLLVVGLILVGVCHGTFMGVFPSFCTDRFGVKYNTVNYGIMFIGFSLAGIIGPGLLTRVYAAAGSYRMAFALACMLAVLGLVLSGVYRKLNRA